MRERRRRGNFTDAPASRENRTGQLCWGGYIQMVKAVQPKTLFLNLQAFFHRHWRKALPWREKVVFREEVSHLILAGCVGVLGGLVNFVFFLAIERVQLFFLHDSSDPVSVAEMLPAWQRAIVPALGGVLAGLILHWGPRLTGGKPATNLLEAVVAGDGRLPLRSGLVRALSSLASIGTGASLGREGGITQVTATLASKWGQLSNWPPYRLRLLVGCGAASGIAAAYNAPIAGAVFASVVVLGNFSMTLFAPLAFASVVAAMVSRSLFGIGPWYSVPTFEFTRLSQLPWFILLGVAAGLLGAGFLKLLRASEEQFRRIKLPIYVKLGLGGLIVGAIAMQFPGVFGNGAEMTNRVLGGRFPAGEAPLLFLGGLLLAKLLATSVTLGSGAVGGLITPTLMLGASLGAAFATALHELKLAENLPTTTFAVVGMGSMLAATTRSPLLAMILVFEICLNYSLMPPLMLGCVVAILTAGRLHDDSIYTEPLRQRGLELGRDSTAAGAAVERTVGDLMHAPVSPVRDNTPLSDVAERFLTNANNYLPVIDGPGRLIGVVALHDLKEFLGDGREVPGVIASDVMRPVPRFVTPGQRLTEALPIVFASELRNIPVVNSPAERRLVGSLARAEVMAILSEAIATDNTQRG